MAILIGKRQMFFPFEKDMEVIKTRGNREVPDQDLD
jgi:hypothetical protein